MYFKIHISLLLSLFTFCLGKIDPVNLKCLVCRITLQELNDAVLNIDPKKVVDVGNFRMDAAGNTMQQKVPAHRSQVFISELLEGICKKLNDYVRVRYKATGKLAVMSMMLDGGMNPEFSKTQFVTDDDLNKSLEYYCERIFEENEEEILSVYSDRPDDKSMPDTVQEICFDHAKFCEPWMLPDEEDLDWTNEKEKRFQEIYGADPYGFGGPPMDLPPQPEQDGGEFDFNDDKVEL